VQAANSGQAPGRVRRFFTRCLNAFLRVTKYELVESCRGAPPPVEGMPSLSLKAAEGVQLSSIRIWTEGEKLCKEHCYHEIEVRGNHRREMGLAPGAKHRDLVCCRCTHKMCITTWSGDEPVAFKPRH